MVRIAPSARAIFEARQRTCHDGPVSEYAERWYASAPEIHEPGTSVSSAAAARSGEHRAFSGGIHQDDDGAGSSLSLDLGINARHDQFTHKCLAGRFVPDPADEPNRSTKAAGENGDIGRRAASYALDPRRVVRPGPRRTS
jgi:hypothetical protein